MLQQTFSSHYPTLVKPPKSPSQLTRSVESLEDSKAPMNVEANRVRMLRSTDFLDENDVRAVVNTAEDDGTASSEESGDDDFEEP